MDGYAVRAEDTRGASEKTPKILKVIDTVIAGGISKKEVTPGTAIRIMTGAPVPRGADSVVQFEDTDDAKNKDASSNQTPEQVNVFAETKTGQSIRHAGEDVARGKIILKKGSVIRPAEMGLVASIGRGRVKVIRRPVVAVLSTGNELIAVDKPLTEGKIFDSNTYSIAGLVKRYGCTPKILGIARDDEKELLNYYRFSWKNLQFGLTITEIEKVLVIISFIRFCFYTIRYDAKSALIISLTAFISAILYEKILVDVIKICYFRFYLNPSIFRTGFEQYLHMIHREQKFKRYSTRILCYPVVSQVRLRGQMNRKSSALGCCCFQDGTDDRGSSAHCLFF
jgi:hypothetical protein